MAKKMKTMAFGLIGLGKHGLRYATHLLNNDVPGARLVAFSRQNEQLGQEFAHRNKLRYYPDYHDLIAATEVEAIAVVTITNLNYPIALEAIAAGKPLLIEKPLALTPLEATRIVAAAEKQGVKLMTAHTLRYNSVIMQLRAEKQRLGQIHTVTMSQRTEPPGLAWQEQIELCGGGNIIQNGIHLFDLLRFIFEDEVARVYCQSEKICNKKLEDSFVALLTLKKTGIKCVIDSDKYTRGRRGKIELVGEQGQLIADYVHHYLRFITEEGIIGLPLPAPVNTVAETLKVFRASLEPNASPPITGLDGIKSVAVTAACYQSSQDKKEVMIPPIVL